MLPKAYFINEDRIRVVCRDHFTCSTDDRSCVLPYIAAQFFALFESLPTIGLLATGTEVAFFTMIGILCLQNGLIATYALRP